LAALQLGLDFLGPSHRQRYRELAVFAGRGAVPRSAIEALWAPAGVSATDAGDLLARFADRGLLRRDPVTGRVELHDLQFDVARADLGDSLPLAHEQLLAGYAARCPGGWPSGPDDGYFYQHLAGHLLAAGRFRDLLELVNRPFLDAKFQHLHSYLGILAEFRNAMQAAEAADEPVKMLALALAHAGLETRIAQPTAVSTIPLYARFGEPERACSMPARSGTRRSAPSR
jgi:hypothetical protein